MSKDTTNGIGSWVAVDLDGTLAYFDHWRGINHVGYPLKPMVAIVRRLLADGMEVRIFTARANDPAAIKPVQDWCEEHLGKRLRVTATKDYEMSICFDDRAIQVEHNTGKLLTGRLIGA